MEKGQNPSAFVFDLSSVDLVTCLHEVVMTLHHICARCYCMITWYKGKSVSATLMSCMSGRQQSTRLCDRRNLDMACSAKVRQAA